MGQQIPNPGGFVSKGDEVFSCFTGRFPLPCSPPGGGAGSPWCKWHWYTLKLHQVEIYPQDFGVVGNSGAHPDVFLLILGFLGCLFPLQAVTDVLRKEAIMQPVGVVLKVHF